MGGKTFKQDRWKLILSVFWFIFTFSMVTWWWIFSLRQLDSIAEGLGTEKYQSLRWMLLWEGSILLAFIFGGGTALFILTNKERLRNLRLRLFFSNFSHDLKTSLSRLRLRAEVLAETIRDPGLQDLLDEVNRLDLQLENSLWVARGEEQNLLNQKISLGDLISQLRVEWPEMEIHLQRDALLHGDNTALRSVFRNLLQNSWLHGQATRIDIQVTQENDLLKISISDNGKGFSGESKNLGRQVLPTSDREGNGIGLYLTKSLLERMDSQIFFETTSGFQVILKIPGILK